MTLHREETGLRELETESSAAPEKGRISVWGCRKLDGARHLAEIGSMYVCGIFKIKLNLCKLKRLTFKLVL